MEMKKRISLELRNRNPADVSELPLCYYRSGRSMEAEEDGDTVTAFYFRHFELPPGLHRGGLPILLLVYELTG